MRNGSPVWKAHGGWITSGKRPQASRVAAWTGSRYPVINSQSLISKIKKQVNSIFKYEAYIYRKYGGKVLVLFLAFFLSLLKM